MKTFAKDELPNNLGSGSEEKIGTQATLLCYASHFPSKPDLNAVGCIAAHSISYNSQTFKCLVTICRNLKNESSHGETSLYIIN